MKKRPGVCVHPSCGYPAFKDEDGNAFRYCKPHGAKVSRGAMGACCSVGDEDIFWCELAAGHPGLHRDGGLTWD